MLSEGRLVCRLTNMDYSNAVGNYPPAQAIQLLRHRVGSARATNERISDWLAAFSAVEERHAAELEQMLRRRAIAEEDLGTLAQTWQSIAGVTLEMARTSSLLAEKIQAEVEISIRSSSPPLTEQLEKIEDLATKPQSEWRNHSQRAINEFQARDLTRLQTIKDALTRLNTVETDMAQAVIRSTEQCVQDVLQFDPGDDVQSYVAQIISGTVVMAADAEEDRDEFDAQASPRRSSSPRHGSASSANSFSGQTRHRSLLHPGFLSKRHDDDGDKKDKDKDRKEDRKENRIVSKVGSIFGKRKKENRSLSSIPQQPLQGGFAIPTTNMRGARSPNGTTTSFRQQSSLDDSRHPSHEAIKPSPPPQRKVGAPNPLDSVPTPASERSSSPNSVQRSTSSQQQIVESVFSTPDEPFDDAAEVPAEPFQISEAQPFVQPEAQQQQPATDRFDAGTQVHQSLRAMPSITRRRNRIDADMSINASTSNAPAEQFFTPAESFPQTFSNQRVPSWPPAIDMSDPFHQQAQQQPANDPQRLPMPPAFGTPSKQNRTFSQDSGLSMPAAVAPLENSITGDVKTAHPNMPTLSSNEAPAVGSTLETLTVNYRRGMMDVCRVDGEIMLAAKEHNTHIVTRIIGGQECSVVLPNEAILKPGLTQDLHVLDTAAMGVNPVTVLKYIGAVPSQVPVFFTPAWRIEDTNAKLILEYGVSPTFALDEVVLNQLIVAVEVQGGEATAAQSRPLATFRKAKQRVTWRFSDPVHLVRGQNQRLLCRFTTVGRVRESPSGVEVRFQANVDPVVHLEVESHGQWAKIPTASAVVTGRFTATSGLDS